MNNFYFNHKKNHLKNGFSDIFIGVVALDELTNCLLTVIKHIFSETFDFGVKLQNHILFSFSS